MASPTTNKGYTYPAHGGGVNTWDTNLNGNFEYQDLNLGGYYSITAYTSITVANTFNSTYATIASTARSITMSASLAQNLFYDLRGVLASSLAINMPAAGSIYVFGNNLTTGSSYEVVAQPTGGSGITLVSGGQDALVFTSSGANQAKNVFGAITTASITNSSGLTTGIITQTSSQYEQMASGDTAARPGAPAGGMICYNTSLSVMEYWNGTLWVRLQAPSKQYLTSGTAATYTTPAGCRLIVIKMIGGGGGGGAAVTNNGSTGGTTSFNSITAIGGGGGVDGGSAGRSGGAGGTGGAGSASLRLPGSGGGMGNAAGATVSAGNGAPGIFGMGAGLGGFQGGPSSGSAGGTNTGAGGGGALNGSNAAGGGASGEYVEIVISSPAATYTYTVGAAGAGGTAGTRAGSAGGTGIIIVEEYY